MLIAAPEVAGFAKTGGLADAVTSLTIALAERGHECAVIMPFYASARKSEAKIEPTESTFCVPIKNRKTAGRLSRSRLPGTDIPVFLIEQSQYFERDNPSEGRGLYQFEQPDGSYADYADNCERFVFFSRAVLETIRLFDYWPDVLHLHDWQTGLVPVYLSEEYAHLDDEQLADRYQQIKTLFTVHNVGYQGLFWHWDMLLTGLDWSLYNHHQLEYHGQMSLLKAGLVFADALSTVSATYAKQLQTEEYGLGLEGVFRERSDWLFGIANGLGPTDPDLGTDTRQDRSWERCAIEYEHLFELMLEQ